MDKLKATVKSYWLFIKEYWSSKKLIILSVIGAFIAGSILGNGFAMKHENLFSDWFGGIATLIAAVVALWLGIRKEKPKLFFDLELMYSRAEFYRLTIYNQEQKINNIKVKKCGQFKRIDVTDPDCDTQWKKIPGKVKNIKNSWLVLEPASVANNKDCGQLDINFDKNTNYTEIVFVEMNTNKKIKVAFYKEDGLWQIKY